MTSAEVRAYIYDSLQQLAVTAHVNGDVELADRIRCAIEDRPLPGTIVRLREAQAPSGED